MNVPISDFRHSLSLQHIINTRGKVSVLTFSIMVLALFASVCAAFGQTFKLASIEALNKPARATSDPLAQAWVRRYCAGVSAFDELRGIAVDLDGNVIVAGHNDTQATGYDWVVLKYSTGGSPMWTNRFNGQANGDDKVGGVAVDRAGNVFVTGYSQGAVSSNDFVTVAYSSAGVPLWTNRYDGPLSGDDQAMGIAVEGGSNVVVTGWSYGNQSDYVTLKYSGDGVPIWTNRFDGLAHGSDVPTAIAVDAGGHVFVTGHSWNNLVWDDYVTVAYSSAGAALWTNFYNGTGDYQDVPAALVVDHSGNVVVTGASAAPSHYPDYATIKYSAAGVPLWTNRYTGPLNDYSYDEAAAVTVDAQDNVFVTGYSNAANDYADYATIAYSSAGQPLWTNRFNGLADSNDYGFAVETAGNGMVFVTGYSAGSDGAPVLATLAYSAAGQSLWTNFVEEPDSTARAFLHVDSSGNALVAATIIRGTSAQYLTLAYSPAGAPLRTNYYNGRANSDDEPRAIAVDTAGHVFVTGSTLDVYGVSDVVTIGYSSAGIPMWTNRYDGPAAYVDSGNALGVDSAGNVLVAGSSWEFDGGQNFLLLKYGPGGAVLWTNRYNGTGNGSDSVVALKIDSQDNVIITGPSTGLNGLSSYLDYTTVKYSAAGVALWTNRYNGPANNADEPVDLALDANDNVVVTGSSFDLQGRSDYLTVKYSSAGIPLWTNRYNGLANASDNAQAVAVDSKGDVFVTGDSWNGSAQEFATVAYSPEGVLLWTNRYHGKSSGQGLPTDVAVDGNGSVFVTGWDGGFGSSDGGYVTIKYSGAGVALWTNHYNGPITISGYNDNARAICIDSHGNVIVTGSSYSDAIGSDYVTIAYSNSGQPIWTNRYNGPANGPDIPIGKQCLAIGVDDSVYVTGASDANYSPLGYPEGVLYNFATIKYAVPPLAPLLQISRVGLSVDLSWPVSTQSFQLEANTDLSAPTLWSPVAEPTVTNGSQISVTVPATAPQNFFRLKAP